MKIRIDIDCTPEEARGFLGLPDVAPMQARLVEAMEERLKQAWSSDPETLMKAWMPGAAPGWEAMKEIWGRAAAEAAKPRKDRP
ncbi:MAG: hypothetical protein FJX46_13150 [Alphaproteobacteria bacterium]|nr:hypothetical protein [Alphaproteobacteria bacterium]